MYFLRFHWPRPLLRRREDFPLNSISEGLHLRNDLRELTDVFPSYDAAAERDRYRREETATEKAASEAA